MNRPVALNRRALWDATLYAVLPMHPEAAGVTLAGVGLLLSAVCTQKMSVTAAS